MALDPKLQNGGEITKWEPSSRKGKFVGWSTRHASTAGMIRNLWTGNISPQHHVVCDTDFATVRGEPIDKKATWTELVITSWIRSQFDEGQNLPELNDEWLSPDELPSNRGSKRGSTLLHKHHPSMKS